MLIGFLIICSLGALIVAVFVWATAPAVTQEIAALILLLISAVCFVGATLLGALEQVGDRLAKTVEFLDYFAKKSE